MAGAAGAAEITLEEAIDFALKHAPDAVAAETTYLTARADLWDGWGNVAPTVTTSYSASRYYDRDAFRMGGYQIPGYKPPAHYYSASAEVSQPLFAGGALFWGVMSGRTAEKIGAASRQEQRDKLVVHVAKSYMNVLKTQGLREVAETSLAASRQAEELARARHEAGEISRAEYLKAVVQKGQAEVAAISAAAAATTARLAFFNTVGMEVDDAATFAPVEPTAPRALPPLEDLISTALRTRPDVIKVTAGKKQADVNVRRAAAGYLPAVAATAGYSWSDTAAPSRETWDEDDEWTIGIAASWNLFDAFRTKANVMRARAAAASARIAADRIRDTVALDIATAYYEYLRLAELLKVAEETAAAAKEELTLVTESYALGGASALELAEAQNRYVEAANAAVEAKCDFIVADYELRRATGELRY